MEISLCYTGKAVESFLRYIELVQDARTHEVKHKINVSVIIGLDNVQQPNDVPMAIQLLQVHDFAERALGVRGIAKGIKAFLQSHDLARVLVDRFPYDAIRLS